MTEQNYPTPKIAAQQLDRAITGLLRSNRQHKPTAVELEEVAAILHLAFDTLWTVMEEACELAPGEPNGLGRAQGWNRAMYDALNLRDHMGWCVSDEFDWDRIEK